VIRPRLLLALALAVTVLVGCGLPGSDATPATQSPSVPTAATAGSTVLHSIYPGAHMVVTIEEPAPLTYRLRPVIRDGALDIEFDSTGDHAGTLFLEGDRRIVLGDLVFHGKNVYPTIGWVLELPETSVVEYRITLMEGSSAVLYRDTPDATYRADIAVLPGNGNGPRTESTFSGVKGCTATTVLGPVLENVTPGKPVTLFPGEHRYADGLTLSADDNGHVQLTFSSAWNIRESGC
jgi:hypothetical protein